MSVSSTAATARFQEQCGMPRRLNRVQHIATSKQLVVPNVAIRAALKVPWPPLVARVNESARASEITLIYSEHAWPTRVGACSFTEPAQSGNPLGELVDLLLLLGSAASEPIDDHGCVEHGGHEMVLRQIAHRSPPGPPRLA
jgi:hypothetical protein